MRFAAQKPELLKVIRYLVGSGQVPAEQIWEAFSTPRDYLIDPVAKARLHGTPETQRIVNSAHAFELKQAQRPVDKGAAYLDLYLKGLGVNSNFSGLNKIPTTYYPIADDIHYKRQFKYSGRGTDPSQKGTVVEFLNLPNTPMMDWDTPGPYHADANATIRHLGDLEELIQDYTTRHPESRLQVYQTPGGFRAWEVGERKTVPEFKERFDELHVDPDYARISEVGMGKTVDGIDIDPAGFRSRISHKPGRVDWVAQPIGTFGSGLTDPQSRRIVKEFHDEPIRQAYLTTMGMSPAAMEALKTHLPTASKGLQEALTSRFGL